jgi:F-type H+-transporting ATPase subunit epsilon
MPIEVEIVSPEKLLLSKRSDMAVVPSSEGDLAAMEQHAPMIVLLRGGLVTLYDGNNPTDTFYVAGGFAEITGDRCTVLADEAIPPGEIDRADAERRLEEAQRAYDETDMNDFDAVPLATARLQVAQSRVDAAA